MSNIFLSASVPVPGRGDYYATASPFLIQFAVRELLTVSLGRRRIIWGGHPAITPMIWAVCEDLGVDYAKTVQLYQSRLFEKSFPPENSRFDNVVVVDAVENDRAKSLLRMRQEMLAVDYVAAVFIGGMEGIFEEYDLFSSMHPKSMVLALSSPGGAAGQLAQRLGQDSKRIDFARIYRQRLGIDPTEPRDQIK